MCDSFDIAPDELLSSEQPPKPLTTSIKSAWHNYVHFQLQNAHKAYLERNPKSYQAHQDAHAHMPGGNTRTVLHADPFPLTFASGSGAALTDVDGHTYTDFLGEYSAGLFGHSHPQILEAVNKAMSEGWNFGGHSTLEKQFAKMLTERFSKAGLELVRFTNSGTEANTCAIATAIAVTGRKKIMVFSNAYHGGTLAFPRALIDGKVECNINLPHDFVYAPYNNIEETKQISDSLPKGSLAAIIVEPIQGSGGCRTGTPEFMHFLRKYADESGALLIVDEVMSSRLAVAGVCGEIGIKADILTLGKYLGGGMTFGAFGGKREIMELFDPTKSKLSHPGTYNNNVLTMSAGIAALQIYNENEVKRLNRLGARLKVKTQEILLDHGIYPRSFPGADADIIEIDSFESNSRFRIDGQDIDLPTMFVTGKGSMVNVRFAGSDKDAWQALYYHHLLANGINVASRGFTALHLVLTNNDIDMFVATIKEFVVKHREELAKKV